MAERRSRVARFTLALLLVTTSSAVAVPFSFVRIGDDDGFGEPSTVGDVAANGAPADTDGDGKLEPGEFIPDRNGSGVVATGAGDDFDNRSAAEVSDSTVLGVGTLSTAGSAGSKWTDISLSTSFAGPNFPDPSGTAVPNNAVFTFDFDVAFADVNPAQSMFLNVVFADYDTTPGQVDLVFADGSTGVLPLTLQGAGDGLIQAAFATLTFSQIFQNLGNGFWEGSLKVTFTAPNEPWLAFDYAELSTQPIPLSQVPEPGTLVLFASAALPGFLSGRRRRFPNTPSGPPTAASPADPGRIVGF